MGKINKKTGNPNTGGNNKNRTGGQGNDGPGHGENHTKDNNHRIKSQKNQGRKDGSNKRY